jgi:type IV pilus assembly protein PilE
MTSAAKPPIALRGFTLIELMIAVAVVAILAAVAMPSYTEYIKRSHRSNARTTLVGAAQWMERAATASGSYPVTASITAGIMAVEGSRYSVAAVSASGQTFTFTATPAAGTPQATDKCGNLTIDQAGRKTTSVADATATLTVECWSR